MRVAFRADASIEIGTGHLMRCLTLADALRTRGAQCLFICREHTGNLLWLVAQRGHDVVALPPTPSGQMPTSDGELAHAHWLGAPWLQDVDETRRALGAAEVDWLVVDHYGLDRRWECELRSHCRRLLVIDDLADRPHDCDMLLDQNLGRVEAEYDDLLPPSSIRLIGPRYALLRPEFARLRNASLSRRATFALARLLVTMGGVDKDNVTGRILDALAACSLSADTCITVVLGPRAPWVSKVSRRAATMPFPTRVLVGAANMAELMQESDLAVGAAGSTSWERCCLGLPTLQVVLAENQVDAAHALEATGAVLTVDAGAELAEALARAVQGMRARPEALLKMSRRAASICDGSGLGSVVSLMFEAGQSRGRA